MGNPLKIKETVGGTFLGLQEMQTTEMDYAVHQILTEFSTSLTGASGVTDGYTRFCWGTNTTSDMKKLKPSTEQYVKPEVGQLLMFPSWLNHSVLPFNGDGERRSLSANINMFPSGE